ncbi:hypothetical protein [Stigmatella aurantiaca]|uniref:Conserved uncharacterized protein n=1 Tax=Stigmatella aurantiaca (strain DW4/3-1) TaxID=378806 RepID=Q08QD8_STIAD|nr:hypothetical protein [Stigmatella aurantiaca]ADO72937.1 conserved uncharacterized protein [Stigmatella aurantiaca DW4/3-1]EAU62697.1 hypothetical protein STIAU_7220 [Stigmatella aurantiaca DW4/3-1]
MATALPPLLPLELRRDAERLFDITLGCLGKDVSFPGGNLLLRRGLSRTRRPEGHKGCSAYGGVLPGRGALTMWGFGVLCSEETEAVLIAREGFSPRLVEAARVEWPVFLAEGLGPLREPVTFEEQRAARRAVVTVAEWLAGYEEWVLATLGVGWRRECLASRRKGSPVGAEELAGAWWRIATRARALEFAGNDWNAPWAGA